MARALDHDLNLGFPTASGQLSKKEKFLDLRPVCGVSQAAGAHPITQT